MHRYIFVCTALLLTALCPPPFRAFDCDGCALAPGVKGGASAADFTMTWTNNPNPNPGQGHGSGTCYVNSNSECTTQLPCRVNGTLTVSSTHGKDVHVHWEGETGGVTVPAGGGPVDFATGYVIITCSHNKDIKLSEGGSSGPEVAYFHFDCANCAYGVE